MVTKPTDSDEDETITYAPFTKIDNPFIEREDHAD